MGMVFKPKSPHSAHFSSREFDAWGTEAPPCDCRAGNQPARRRRRRIPANGALTLVPTALLALLPLNIGDASAITVRQRHRTFVIVLAALITEMSFRTFGLEAEAAVLENRIALGPKLVAVVREGGLHRGCKCCDADKRCEELSCIFHDDLQISMGPKF